MIPQMQNIYHYIKIKLLPEMRKYNVPELNEKHIRELSEKGKTSLTFGSLTINFFIVEKDLYSPMTLLSNEESMIIKKYNEKS